jgi:hypothetical protein
MDDNPRTLSPEAVQALLEPVHPMTGRDHALNACRNGLELVRLGACLNAACLLLWKVPQVCELAWLAGVLAAATSLASAYFSANALAWFPNGHPIARRLYPIAVLSTVMVYIFWLIGIIVWRF